MNAALGCAPPERIGSGTRFVGAPSYPGIADDYASAFRERLAP
jgi:hypothetical protein